MRLNNIIMTAGLLASLMLSGCAANTAKPLNTESGKPEVVILGSDISTIKNLIISDMLKYKYSIERDTDHMLEFSRAATSGEDFAISMSIGNGSTTNKKFAAYTFVNTDNGIRVIASSYYWSQFPSGRINTRSVDRADNQREYQRHLNILKEAAEKGNLK